jgi:hypothetical protein
MTLLEDLAITAEMCGSEFSDAAAKIFLAELKDYDPAWVHGALARCRRELSGKLTLAAVVSRLTDGRPGPEEAWSMLPKDEWASGIMTMEMQEAMGPALRLIAQGDSVAARMAFLEGYKKAVTEARAKARPCHWAASYGWNPAGRFDADKEASERNRELGYAVKPLLEGPTGGMPPIPLPRLPDMPK